MKATNRTYHTFEIGDIHFQGYGDMKTWEAYKDKGDCRLWCGDVQFHKSTTSLVASRVCERILDGVVSKKDRNAMFGRSGRGILCDDESPWATRHDNTYDGDD